MLVTHDVTIDVSRPKQPNVIHVVQGDSSRVLRITLRDENATYNPEADLTSGEILNMAVTFDKSDGTRGGYEKATWQATGEKAVVKESTGVYKCYLDQQCFSAPGIAHVFIRFFTNKGRTIHTFAVMCDVEPNPSSNVTSHDFVDMPSNEELLDKIDDCVQYVAQTPSASKRKTARANIGACSWYGIAREYSNNTTYKKGQFCYFDGYFRRCLIDGTQGIAPSEDGANENWSAETPIDVGLRYAVSAGITQSFSEAEKARARANIGVGEAVADAVRYGAAQALTEAQQAQARANIGAASTSPEITDVVRYGAMQALTAEQKRTARSNIGAPDTNTVVKLEPQHLSVDEKQQARANIDAVPLADIALEYNPAGTYHTGEIRYHEGTLYTCISEISVPELWNASHWQPVYSIADTLRSRVLRMDVIQNWISGAEKAKARSNIGAAAAAETATKDSIAPLFDETVTYAIGDIVFHDDAFYICTTAIVDPGEWDASNWAEYETIADAILGNVVRYDAPQSGISKQKRQQARDNIDARDVSVILVDDSNSHLPISGTAYVNSQQIIVGLLSGQMPRVGDVVIGTDSGRICSVSSISMFAPNHMFEVDASGFDLFHGIPAAPTTDGTYTLQATVSDGVVTYAWT